MNSSSLDVHNMEYETRKDLLKQNFHDLGQLLKATVAHPSQFIEHDQLAAFKISLTDFSLDSDTASNAVPRFFKPFPHDLMEESFKRSSQFEDDLRWPPYKPEYLHPFSEALVIEGILGRYRRYVFEKWEESPLVRIMWRGRCPLERREFKHAEDLWEMRKGLNVAYEEWRVNTVFYTVLDSKPHFVCPLIDCAMPDDDRIRRAELLGILRLMKSAMRHASGRKPMVWHTIYPVAIYSFANRKARVLHAHYEGKTLHIRRSNYLDFTEKNMDNIKLYLRWMMSELIGDTMSTDKDTRLHFKKHDPHTSNHTAVSSSSVKLLT